MYKAGDKLYCKQNFGYPSNEVNIIFCKNIIYDIISVSNIQIGIGIDHVYYYMHSEHLVSKYFYTEKELRMIKLERLSNVL